MAIVSLGRAFRMVMFATTLIIGPLSRVEALSEDIRSIVWLIGEPFRQELEKPFSANWSREELRHMLLQVSTGRRISFLLDRRLDPSAEFPMDVTNVTLISGLTKIAHLANGDISVPENIVFVGPESATRRLRTLIELRMIELRSKETGIPERRQSELQRRRTIEWHDLDSPLEILEKIAKQFQLRISNGELIAHDLWAGAVLPDVTITEALSVILIQFDLTFRWTEAGTSIELVPIPESVSLERKHHSKQKPADTVSLIRQQFPGLQAEVSNSDVVVKGFLEDHEAVSGLLRNGGSTRSPKVDPLQSVGKRSFTFHANQPVPIIAVMKKLEESDIRFEYDTEELKASGVDLEQMIQLDVKNMPANEFFHSIFGKARLEFQFEHLTVKLKPKTAAASKK